jgi:hypothetical protein
MRRQRRQILLLVDNCSAHPPTSADRLTSIKLSFLPPNATAVIQPCDQGIIRNLKGHYRSQVVHKIIADIDLSNASSGVLVSDMCWNPALAKQFAIVCCFTFFHAVVNMWMASRTVSFFASWLALSSTESMSAIILCTTWDRFPRCKKLTSHLPQQQECLDDRWHLFRMVTGFQQRYEPSTTTNTSSGR